ncbi:anaerobic carbon-monoxide dehydrogenase catalytic subunit [Dethiobacter alkaliphilus]|uniref:Carbon monoxide dehydrogenase n=1 Tax=Dethiobacter alkaliphilus AHT 1 TaxID=555088 RepID=C0GF48_DETAL|nr:anaerobic carbon-monoxide dehydrogenase catalytic subunit [Dethiobacter alkaliphilus]EEG78230.1 carbon-monoxide dehydrogenase, catalytic subunit [Dethiobacter alkaliphilus AHT 1]
MSDVTKKKQVDRNRSIDPAVLEVLSKELPCDTAYDRYVAQQPQCKFGDTGVCCRICIQGPCRITNKAPKGICGATAYTIVARNLVRTALGGASAHSDHSKHILLTLKALLDGHAPDYSIKSPEKLRAIAERFEIATEGREDMEILADVVKLGMDDYMRMSGDSVKWIEKTVTPGRVEKFKSHNIMPTSVFETIASATAQTHMGMDADPVNLIFKALEAGLADYTGMHIGTDMSDVLFGVPTPVFTEANMGVINPNKVNIAVHGHNPLLSEMIVQAARDMEADAKAAGAEGIQLMGICCTGNEVLMRQGVPPVTNFLSQELPMMTGAIDAMVVDVQCIMPGVQAVAECYNTRVITTSENAKIPGAHHIDFSEEKALEQAKHAISIAIDGYKEREGVECCIPSDKNKVVAGFSVEALYDLFSAINADAPIKVITDALKSGELRGVALFAGCNNLKGVHDENHMTIAKELAKNDVLLLATGCAAGTYAKMGLLTPAAIDTYAGDGLKAFIKRLNEANAGKLEGDLPLIFHLGSCVDNTRATNLATAIANDFGVDVPKIPFVASAPEAMSEKAVAIGLWNVAMGLPVHVGVVPPVTGSDLVNGIALQVAHDVYGGYFMWETDGTKAAAKMLEALDYRSWKLKVHAETAEKFSAPASAAW